MELIGARANDRLIGCGEDDRIYGRGGDDTLDGQAGHDLLRGQNGSDRLIGGDGDDILRGGRGDDFLIGGEGLDRLIGGAGSDTASFAGITGVSIDLRLVSAQDTGAGLEVLKSIENLIGTLGVDDFTANASANNFNAGPGDDTFRFFSAADLDGDSITKLRGSGFDHIDLSGIDTDEVATGDQAFTLVGAFTGHPGEARYDYAFGASTATVQLDMDGDGAADATLTVSGNDFGNIGFVL